MPNTFGSKTVNKSSAHSELQITQLNLIIIDGPAEIYSDRLLTLYSSGLNCLDFAGARFRPPREWLPSL